MNAIELLLKEHQSHRKLVSSPSQFKRLRDELIHHINIEETILYPGLLRIPELEMIVREAWEEHSLMMGLIQEMDELDQESKLWLPKFNSLKKHLEQHLIEEESDLFPKILGLASEESLLEMGLLMKEQQKALSAEEILYPEVQGSHKLTE